MIDERVAYHEAGHALVLYHLEIVNMIDVVMDEMPHESILASTIYEKDSFQSIIMEQGKSYGQQLIQVAVAGCEAERIYHERLNDRTGFLCFYGTKDYQTVNQLLKAMSLGPTEAWKIQQECERETRTILKRYEGRLVDLASLFASGKKRTYDYSDISSVLINQLP